jgi:hypothetical protein
MVLEKKFGTEVFITSLDTISTEDRFKKCSTTWKLRESFARLAKCRNKDLTEHFSDLKLT